MRRIITFIAVIVLFITASAQINSLAVLDHEGELTYFDNVNSLEDALSAAIDGDKIYLSSGVFGGSKTITIGKAVSIIGCGYDSRIVPEIKIGVKTPYSSPAFVGVQLEKLSAVNGSIPDSVKVEISTCKIKSLDAYYFKELHVERCYINDFNNYDLSSSICKKVVIKNSKIGSFEGSQNEIVQNCNIRKIEASSSKIPYILTSSIVGESHEFGSGSSLMEYCLIGKNCSNNTGNGNLIVENCYRLETDGNVLDDNLECTVDLVANKYLGLDGTPVGIYGGDWLPYTENPSLPAVDNSASSVTYDSESKKLKVSIKIKGSETK